MRRIFVGRNGIRAGWRLLIYFAIAFTLVAIAVKLFVPNIAAQATAKVISAPALLVRELVILIPILIAAFIMSRIERRPMGDYGLPLREAFRGRFWVGVLTGFLSLTCVLALIFFGHGLHVSWHAASAGAIAVGALGFAAAMIAVGLSEEFLSRGYTLVTLAQGIRFWPAAVLLALGFAAGHGANPGENTLGLVQTGLFALVLSYVRLRTGTLWFAVGYHAAWDWAETFFYGVPDSGHLGTVSLLDAKLSGPAWLSGGSDGPEGSIFALLALFALIPLVNWLEKSKAPQGATSMSARASAGADPS